MLQKLKRMNNVGNEVLKREKILRNLKKVSEYVYWDKLEKLKERMILH